MLSGPRASSQTRLPFLWHGTVGFLVMGALSAVAVLVTIALESPSETFGRAKSRNCSPGRTFTIRVYTSGVLHSASTCEFVRDGVLIARWQDDLSVSKTNCSQYERVNNESWLSCGDERLATATANQRTNPIHSWWAIKPWTFRLDGLRLRSDSHGRFGVLGSSRVS